MAADRQYKFKIVLFGRGQMDIREDTWENMVAMLGEVCLMEIDGQPN